MPNSEAPSKLKKRLKIWLPLSAAVLLALALALGPTLFLRLTLARLFPAESGLVLNFAKARAGFLLGSAEVAGLVIEDRLTAGGPPVLTLGRLRLDGVSTWNLIRLLGRPEGLSAEPMFLAEEVYIEGLDFHPEAVAASLREAHVRRLQIRPKPSPGDVPLMFDKLEARGLKLGANPEKLSFSRLEARDLGQDFLAGLSLRDFFYDSGPGPIGERRDFKLDALTLGGLRLEAVRRMLAGETAGQALWGFLSACDTLDLVRGALNLSGVEALNLRSVNFDSVARPTGATGFLRRLDLTVDLKAISGDSGDLFWADLRDTVGDRLQAGLSLEIDYYPPVKDWDPSTARAELKTIRLESPELGRLELTGALAGVRPVKSHHSPSQLLLSVGSWSLEKMKLSFEDRGLAAKLYRHLDHSVFRGSPNRQSGANIIQYIVRPLARDLEYEQGLDNLPALVSEVEAFLLHPKNLTLSAEPSPPLPLMPMINSVTLSLANQGKYDIIEKLRLTLAVNDRAPIFVAVASGVFKENLPRAPKPMENAFDEETITEEDI